MPKYIKWTLNGWNILHENQNLNFLINIILQSSRNYCKPAIKYIK